MWKWLASISSGVPVRGAWWRPMPVGEVSLEFCYIWDAITGKLTVGEVCLKQVVVSSCDLGHDFSEVRAFLVIEVGQGPLVCLCNDHDLEWPGCPPGTACPEALVLEYCTLAFLAFELGVVFQQVAIMVVSPVLLHALEFDAGFFRQAGGCPNLAVRMRVGAAHGGTLVLENLHVAVLLFGSFDQASVRF